MQIFIRFFLGYVTSCAIFFFNFLINSPLTQVHNFVNLENGYRNLRRTKFRLTKGDDMLKYMYDSIGHHVTEFPLSDFEYYMYLARVTPLRVLRHHVRGVFQAKEYASSMRALYASSPVECIPEFFTDPAVHFFSLFFSLSLSLSHTHFCCSFYWSRFLKHRDRFQKFKFQNGAQALRIS